MDPYQHTCRYACPTPPSPRAKSALVTMEMSAGYGKWNVNISGMGRSTIKHVIGGGGSDGQVGIETELFFAPRWSVWSHLKVNNVSVGFSQPGVFCTAGVCWRLINCCWGGAAIGCSRLANQRASDEKQKCRWKGHFHQPCSQTMEFYHPICFNEAEDPLLTTIRDQLWC